MIDAILTGLVLVFQWPAIGYLLLGVFIGIWIGAVPGLGGPMGLVLLLPFTYGMDSVAAFALLLGMFAVTSTSDTVASVMLGVPGTAASQATILDGFPLAQKGHAQRAFGAAFTVSAIGGVVGAVLLAVSFPIALPLIEKVGSPEIFSFSVLALTMVASLAGNSVLKGLSLALFGLLLSTIGYSESEAFPRYWFGSDYLIDGLPLIPVVMGLFAIPELMDLALKNISISQVADKEVEGGRLIDGVKDVLKHKWLAIRCALMGTYIGVLPGLGASITDWLAYGHAVQSAKDKSQFGKGDIRGVIAPEAANNANKGGALVPTVVLGIPGNLGCAILMGALLIQGLKPGPDMLIDNLHITFSIVWTLAIANVVAAIGMMVMSRQVAKIAFVPGHLIVPGIILFIFMGSWIGDATLGNWISLVLFGILGYIMKKSGWPRPPLILAFILGPTVENSFYLSMLTHEGIGWLSRPIVMVTILLILVTLFFSVKGILKAKKTKEAPKSVEGNTKNPYVSLPLGIFLAFVFIGGGSMSLDWPEAAMQFPFIICVPAGFIVLTILIQEVREVQINLRSSGNLGASLQQASQKAYLAKAVKFFSYLFVVLLVSMVVGQKIALPLFVFFYLRCWGGYGKRLSLIYALCSWVAIVAFYDRVMHLFWYPSWASSWLPELLPSWFPAWLIF